MRKFLSLIVFGVFVSACTSNTPQPNFISDADQVATIVAATLAAHTSTEISATPTLPNVDSFSLNGQLQGKLAYIRNNNLWVSINGIESQLTNDADSSHIGLPKLWYSNPQISPDGNQVAYLKDTFDISTYAKTTSLIVSSIDGKNIHQIDNTTGAEWSNDSQKVYYSVSNGYDVTTGMEAITVKSINLPTGELQEYGHYGVMQGCGGGSSDPADHISSKENIIGTLGLRIFSLSPQNTYVLHPTICSSGLGLLDLSTKQDRTLDDNVRGATISPDGSKIATVSNNGVMIFNVITGRVENTFPTSETPRAILWAADNKGVFYSTSRLASTLTLDDTVALDLFGSAPTSFNLNVSTLWMLSVESGQSTKIFEIEAHDLKPIFDNGQRALVAVVENASKLFDYVSQGNRENLAEYYPTANIIEVDLANSSFNTLTNNTKQASYFK